MHTDNIRALDDDDFDDAPAWNVGSVGADGDFPTLTVHSAATQGAAIAYGLTRISLVGGRVLSEEDPTLVSDLSPTIVFDRNGDAADRACVAGANGAIATGYNDATVRVSLPTGAVAAAGGVCGYVLTGFDSGEMTLTVSFASGGDSIAREYPMQIDETPGFVAKIAADGFDWFSPDLDVAPDGTPTDWDGDGVDNPYDWTPLPAVDLLGGLTDPGSSASNPWPIYNVWQLQAIDGMSVSQAGAMSAGLEIFDGERDRLRANYRLALDIDAKPTRGWDGGKGFNPIGFSHTTDTSALEIFRGVFDGGGNVVRGLRINRGSSFHNGLFAVVSGRVTRLGLDDVFVLGGNGIGASQFASGALVGNLRGGVVSESWARGEVSGFYDAGGLIGSMRDGGAARVTASWFAGRVVSRFGEAGLAAGLTGQLRGGSLTDSWAAVDITVAAARGFAFVHELAVNQTDGGSLTRLWGEGFLSGHSRAGTSGQRTHYSNIRGLEGDDFDDEPIWNVGTDNDFPALTVHSRNLQAAAVAAGLSRVVGINGATVAATREREITNGQLAGRFESMRIERINGDIPALDCSFSDGALRAQMGYNMATAIITLIAPDAELEQRGAPDSCEINLVNNSGGDATLRFVYASRVDPAAPEARLTTDYDLTIARDTAALARTEFAEEIAAGDFNWFAARNSNPAHDWDDDGIANPYDWTPTSITIMVDGAEVEVGVNLTVNGVDPWPIYNVWQLQAIDGLSVSEAGVTTGGFELFGNEAARLAANYRLAMNIDATPTESWQSGIGFDPIGDTFTGSLDGEGREIRGLHINKSEENGGLFNVIGTGGRVSRLGLPDIDVRASGFRSAGLAAHLNGGTVRLVWASGTAQGAISNNAGLIGYLESGDLRESWFVGDIVGGGGNGGLVGLIAAEGEIADSWAMAQVRQTIANQPNGGLIGRANGGVLTTSWSGGPVADGDNSGGIIGKPTTGDSALAGGAIYLDTSTSGGSKVEANDVAAVISAVETMATVASGLGAAWVYGGATDYPFLSGFDAGLQAVYFADFQTRIFYAAAGGNELPAGVRTELTSRENITLILDTNGEATAAPTPIPTCEADADGVIVAKTNYNNVTIRLRATGDGSAVFTNDCKIVISEAGEDPLNISVDALIATGETTISGWSHSFNVNLNEAFLAKIATGDDWFASDLAVAPDGTRTDWDDDGIDNPYDWTPLPGINLTLHFTGEGGTADNPWPIYNVWQLQAIDGMSVSDAGKMAGGLTLFGDTATRLTANYLLARDIDATPTRRWNGGKGFNPIGFFDSDTGSVPLNFTGVFDGGGNVVRGLHIVSDSVNNGLFGIVSGGVVASLGLDDVFVSGENGSSHSGALAGSLMSGGAVRESWARGRVNGREAVGGLLGQATRGGGEPPSVSVSWFAGWVAADGDPTLFRRAGGLVGNPGVVGITDSWAAVSVAVSSDNPYAGELVGSVENETDLLRLWGEGVFSGVDSRDGSPASQISLVYYDNIRGLNRADDFDDAAIWDTGTDADYPVLTVHSRNLQGAAIAAGLSRVVGINGATAVTATRPIVTLGAEFAAIRIEKLTVETPDLACSFSDGALRAGMGFNAATVIITLIALDAELERRGDDDSCEANVINNSGGGVTLRILHVSRADAAAPEARLTTDYDLVIEVDLLASARKAREAFVAAITTDDFGWSSPALIIGSGTTLDWDDDGIANVYDWTPTSVTITLGGTEIEFEVNLTLDGVDPWPVFNVWQLQAIDGMSVSDVGKMTGGLELFGDTATRLGANYRLMMDIDATPTRGWDDGKGFNPIGTLDLDLDDGDDSEKFTGEFDGDDNVVRGLRIVRDTESNGLFGFVSGGVVENLGLDDVFVFGETGVRHSGALVGIMLGGKVRESWARGGVYGRLAVGGLVGSARPSEVGSEAPNVSASWFAGRVAVRGSLNDNLRVAGGLVGSPNVLEITDSWAAVDITVINTRSPRAGELVGNVGNILVSVSRSWGEGYSSGLTRPNPVESQVYYDNIRTLGRADDFGDAAIWDTGTDADFPILNPPHSAATQGAAIAAGLSRVVGINDGASVVAALRADNAPLGKEFEAIRIEKVSADTPDLDCDFSDGALRAEVGYNMATVIITLIAFDAELRGAADSCEIDLVNNLGGDATLRFIYTSRVDPAAPEARLTTDYDLTIALDEAMLAPAARDAFVAAIATVAFGWSSPALIVGSGTSLDWDDDGIANPYDWTPTSVKIMAAGAKVEIEVNLTLSVGGANPWPIYNVWQLQAIDGMSVSEDGTLSGDLALFGADKDAGLTTQYRLEMDIDATRTRKWKDGDGKTVGFDPIGGDFTGGLDGNGKVVRGLFIDRTGDDIGLFSKIITDGGLAVSGLGVEEAEIRGGNGVGIIAGGATDSSFSEVWTTGKVVGSGQDIGGLIGVFSGNTNLAGTIMMSWSAADVEGNGGNVGGLTGLNHSDSVSVNLDDNWAAGDVRGSQDVGGFSGSSSGVIYNRNWSSGAVFGGLPSGGFAGSNVLGGDEYNFAYWNDDTRNVSTSGGGGVGVILQTLSSVSFGGAAAAAWDFGDSVLSNTDGVADFPLLKSSDRALQAVYLARALTRVLSAADSEEIAAGTSIIATDAIRLDTNGLAPDTGTTGTSIPTCAVEDGELRANANYNGVSVKLTLITDGKEASFVAAGDCEVTIEGVTSEIAATLRLEISATDDDGARSLTTDYALRIAPDPSVEQPIDPLAAQVAAAFVTLIAAGDFDWFSDSRIVGGGNALDWDGDGIANPYDWTPTSVALDGPGMVAVNLTLDGSPDGSAGSPWPIYNVWQLQAIDGVSVSGDGTTVTAKIERTESDGTTVTLDFAFFGDSESERLGAHYRLATHIDATPTRDWADGGFRPIGGASVEIDKEIDRFQGGLNGDGWEIRGLSVGVAEKFVGMFAGIGNSGVVASLLLSDLRVSGNSGAGAATGGLVGVSSGAVRFVGGSGVVRNEKTENTDGADIGGLAGRVEQGAVEESWFAGEVGGNPHNSNMGGLIGVITGASSRGENNWSQARLDDTNIDSGFNGGLIGGVNSAAVVNDSWAGGEVVGDNVSGGNSTNGLVGSNLQDPKSTGYSDRSTSGDLPPGAAAQVVETMVTLNDGAWNSPVTVWNFGDTVVLDDGAADYPFLKRYEAIVSERNRSGAQAVFYALQQTRLRLGGEELTVSRGGQFTLASGDVLRLDTNGRADEDNADDPTPKPSCELNSGEVRATTNYNGVTVFLRSDGNATFSLTGGCDVDIRFGGDVDAFTLTVVVEAGEASATKSYSFVAGVFSEALQGELLLPPEAKMGEAAYTVAIGAGASLRPFSDVNDLSSGGGSPGILSLGMDATAVFATDNAFFSLTLTAALRGGGDETRAVRVQSAVRLIGDGELLEINRYESEVGAYLPVLLNSDWGLSIWHNGDVAQEYPPDYAFDLAVIPDLILNERNVAVGGTALTPGVYTITLSLIEGDLQAERELRVNVLAGSPPTPLEIVVPEPQPLVVAADASAGVTILTVSTSGGTNPTFADAANDNLEASGGGDTALVSLTEDAAVAFASDNLTLSLPLTANADGESATATIRFVSAPRAIDNSETHSRTFSSAAAVANTEVLAGGASGLAIWHFDGNEIYTLGGADSASFDVDGGTGEVEIGSALAADTTYNFDLQLVGGESGAEVTATRAVQVIVDAAAPPVIAAPAEAVTVAANAVSSSSVTTFVLESGEGAFGEVADGDLRTGGGDEAAVTLARSAALVFDPDGLTLSLTLTAIGVDGSDAVTIRFVSAPRAISQDDLSTILLAEQAELGDVILAAGASQLSIWHNGDNSEIYSVASAGDNFGADPTTGLVTVLAAGGLSAGDYVATLYLTDGDIQATRRLLVDIEANPQDAARALFVAEIAAGDFDWFSASRVVAGVGNPLDWDGDGIANPYDWTPTPDVNLTLDGSPDGSAGNPWPIYNVWQLQAIDGVSVSGDGTTVTAKIERTESDGTTVTLDFAFFGDSESERLGAHYRLAAHIDATPTRDWVGGGFRPIGGADIDEDEQTDRFQGGLNGDGWEIRGLSVGVAEEAENFVGMFAGIGDNGVVASLLLSDLQVSGNSARDTATGGLVGVSSGRISLVGGSGVVRNENTSGGVNIGGLAGHVEGGTVEESWFAGEVAGNPDSSGMGGLIGRLSSNGVKGENNWAQARLEDSDFESGFVAGLVGSSGTDTNLNNSWAGGEASGISPRGLIDEAGGAVSRVYSDRSTSGGLQPGGTAQAVETMVTLNDGNWNSPVTVWNFGDTVVLDDGAADYPFLKRYETIAAGRASGVLRVATDAVAFGGRRIDGESSRAIYFGVGRCVAFGHKRPRGRGQR